MFGELFESFGELFELFGLCWEFFDFFLLSLRAITRKKTGLMALSKSLSRYKRAGESLFQLLSRFLAGDMADHDSTRQTAAA